MHRDASSRLRAPFGRPPGEPSPIRDPDPVVFLEPKRIYRAPKEPLEDDGEALPLDRCFVVREGRDLTLVSWGALLGETLEAADHAGRRGDRGGGDRRRDAEAVRCRDGAGVGGPDRPVRDRPRGAAHGRVRRRDRGRARRGGPVLAAGTRPAGHRTRTSRCRCRASSRTISRAPLPSSPRRAARSATNERLPPAGPRRGPEGGRDRHLARRRGRSRRGRPAAGLGRDRQGRGRDPGAACGADRQAPRCRGRHHPDRGTPGCVRRCPRGRHRRHRR